MLRKVRIIAILNMFFGPLDGNQNDNNNVVIIMVIVIERP